MCFVFEFSKFLKKKAVILKTNFQRKKNNWNKFFFTVEI